MKAILEFKLPKDKIDHDHAVNAWKYSECLINIWNKFREMEKYEDRQTISVTEARQIVIDIFNENGINIDEL